MTIAQIQLSDLQEVLLEASLIAQEHFGSSAASLECRTKGNDTPVTRVDREISALLRNRLQSIIPDSGWLGEEDRDDSSRLSRELVWIVDPLDGTKEFIRGIPEVAISVALVRKGNAIAGAVCNPITGEQGLWSEAEGSRFAGFAEESGLGAIASLGEAIVSASRTEFEKGGLASFWPRLKEIRPIGSVAYKLLRIAAQQENLYFSIEPKSEWDICGGVALITAAGMSYVRFDGIQQIFNSPSTRIPSGAVAGAGHLVNAFCAEFQGEIHEAQGNIETGIVK